MINRLVELGYVKPSKIQSRTVPFMLVKSGVGIMAQSHNGSGKTLSFVIPAILRVDPKKPLQKTETIYLPQVIILAPNMELCSQIIGDLKRLAAPFTDVKISNGEEPAHIVVRTPEKIKNQLLGKYKNLDLSQVNMIIVDEADDQLKNDSLASIQKIVEKTPKTCALCFFSATYTESAIKHMNEFMESKDNLTILKYFLPHEELKLEGIYQFSKKCDDQSKGEYIDKLLKSLSTDAQIIIFVNTKKFAQLVYEQLKAKGHNVALIMGGMTARDRTEAINAFRQSKFKILITTNLLARGFDQRTVGLVINLDIPRTYGSDVIKADRETYLHRIGRTGRFGDVGLALNLYTKDEEKQMLDDIANHYQVKIQDLNSIPDSKAFDMINDCLEQVIEINQKKREETHEKIGPK